ncbi:MAG: rod shape-determining protein MreC [Patescibacteria group bacterium]|jgi:rod shape-determining protein MreC|nr:rod shape-determining protein MreC [Patescibacteria group bacterium]
MNHKQKNNLIILIIIYWIFLNLQFVSAATESKTFFENWRTFFLNVVKNIDYWINGVIKYKDIQEENNFLIFQNRALKSLLIEYQDLKYENELLKDALQLKKSKNLNFVLANIVGRSPLNFSQTFIIDKGEEDGIKVGQIIVWAGKTLVGEVIDVSKSFSTARAITDSDFKAAVFVGEKKSEGLFKGNGFLEPRIDLIPVKEEINAGDVVYTSGLDNKFIKNLYIGEVEEAVKPAGKVFQEIKVKPAVDWTKLYQVLVIL